MVGMNATNGRVLQGVDHLEQSIRDILSTPIGSRVMRRDYGSRLMNLVDRPMSQELIGEIQAAVAMALTTQEPRIRLTRVQVDLPDETVSGSISNAAQGKITIRLEGYSALDGQVLTLEDITLP